MTTPAELLSVSAIMLASVMLCQLASNNDYPRPRTRARSYLALIVAGLVIILLSSCASPPVVTASGDLCTYSAFWPTQSQASSYVVCGQYLGKWEKPPVEICRKKAPLPDVIWVTRSDTGFFYFWKGHRINQYIKYFEEVKK